jgi:acyl-CoA reductase-like NAD-dependent aldehyde dehydrogenase
MNASASAREVPTASTPGEVDAAVESLRARADAWVATTIPERLALLRQISADLWEVAEAWVHSSVDFKGVPRGSNAEGQEWASGLLAISHSVRFLTNALEAGGQHPPVRRTRRADGREVVRVYPDNLLDKMLFMRWSIDLWCEENPRQGGIYRRKQEGESWPGKVSVVLGAGNQIFLGPTDMLHKLFVEDEVVALKMNPVNVTDGPYVERAFRALIDAGFLRVLYGGTEVGIQLCEHDDVDSIHLTGSDRTHDAIVWGVGEEAIRRKSEGTPRNPRPVSSELGCVSPYLIVPGPWSAGDLDYHARQLVSGLAQNAGHNCAAAQLVMIARDWDLRDAFMDRVRAHLAQAPARPAYYPGSAERRAEFVEAYPDAEEFGGDVAGSVPWTLLPSVPMDGAQFACRTESFCGVLGVVDVPVGDAPAFLHKAVPYCNDEVWGNLSCSVMVHPKTVRAHREACDRAIADLRYGTVAVNAWGGAGAALMASSWGGHPGNALSDIQSGIGVGHNHYLWEGVQKTVLTIPFRMRPLPPWFIDHRSLAAMGRGLVRLQHERGLAAALQTIRAALRG